MFYLIIALSLMGFWVVLSGHFTLLLLSFGVVSSVFVAWLLRRMDRVDQETVRPRLGLGLLGYGLWLLWCVVKANIDLARRIWHPKLPIHPVWERLEVGVETPMEQTLYANSITLTPGTLTTEVQDDHFMVHCVSQEGLDELREGEMERRIRRLGSGR